MFEQVYDLNKQGALEPELLRKRLNPTLDRFIVPSFKDCSKSDPTLEMWKEKIIPLLISECKLNASAAYDYKIKMAITSKCGVALGRTRISELFLDVTKGEFKKEYEFKDFLLMVYVSCKPI